VTGSTVASIPVNPILRVGASSLLAWSCTSLSAGTGAILGALGELAAFVTDYVLRLMTANEALIRTASRGARLLGGFYLANLTGWAPLAFGPSTVLLTLGAAAIAHYTVATVNDVFAAVGSSFRIRNELV